MSSLSLTHLGNSLNEHVMLLYKDKNKLENNIIDYINEGLKNDYLCIYAFVDIDHFTEIAIIDNISTRIVNYEKNIQEENLQFINFKPYYESALKGDLTLFEKLKLKLEYLLHKRLSEGKKDKILIIAEAAGFLSNKFFHKSIDLEQWWHNIHSQWITNNKNITIICPHPDHVFGKEKSMLAIRNKLNTLHTLTLYSHNLIKQPNNNSISTPIIKILIAEPEPDLQNLYTEYLSGLGLEVLIVENGNECLENLFGSSPQDKQTFDMIIVDSHLQDINGIELAKRIRQKIPNQRIVFTTTYSSNQVSELLDSLEIDKDD